VYNQASFWIIAFYLTVEFILQRLFWRKLDLISVNMLSLMAAFRSMALILILAVAPAAVLHFFEFSFKKSLTWFLIAMGLGVCLADMYAIFSLGQSFIIE